MSRFSILVFHRAAGFVHRSIPDAVGAITELGGRSGIAVETTDDPSRFRGDELERFAALVFVHTSGNVLPHVEQREALERYIGGGGGFVGIHAASSMASDVRDDWPWFRELVGAAFKGHTATRAYSDEPVERPGVVHAGPLADAPEDAEWASPKVAITTWEPATIAVEPDGVAIMGGFVDGEVVTDEWYGFDENPRPTVRVAATVDETTYNAYRGAMGDDHPVAWWHEFSGGRAVYNSMGHSAAKWREPKFLDAVLGGIELAAG